MLREGTSRWLWTWMQWVKVKCGSTVKASDATGTSIKHLETAANATMPVGSVRRNASETAVKLLKDGNMKLYVAQIFHFSDETRKCDRKSLVLPWSNLETYVFRYHVPRSWLRPTGNLLVVFEEWGGNPNGITLTKREVASVCADIYEWQPTLVNWQLQASGKVDKPLRPKAHLSCDAGQKITSIKFASFGTPQGVCGNFREGSCHAHHSYDVFEKVHSHPSQCYPFIFLWCV